MDSISFDYDQYFSEETFVIDDFGEICEDIVRIASAGTQYLCKEFDNEQRNDSPPPGSFIASNRGFEKEVPSLFSEMEYLTEVSPETDVALPELKPVTIVVNPAEFSCKRQNQTLPNTYIDEFLEEPSPNQPECFTGPMAIAGKPPEESTDGTCIAGNLTDPIDYQRILNNYIQKGRRKLEASSYSKMKASCLANERKVARSTSLVETVTVSSLLCQGRGKTHLLSSPAASKQLPGHGTTSTATVRRLPFQATSEPVHPHTHTADQIKMREDGPCSTLRQSLINRPAVGSLKAVRAYRCQDCNASFPSSELLRKHACIIDEQYQCHLCLREFKKRKTLDHHMKSHDKVFSTDDDLRK